MVDIISVGIGSPSYDVSQEEVKMLIQHIYGENRRLKKLSTVFDHAFIERRQFVKEMAWYERTHSFPEKNAAFMEGAVRLNLEAIDNCMEQAEISLESIDAIISVTSSGIATPSLDAHLINERNFRDDVVRMPLWGLGCAGGAIGLSRAFDYLRANSHQTVLLVACELCSLTFQKEDEKMSNLVGTALFGDGAAAVLLAGDNSPIQNKQNTIFPSIRQSSSRLKKQTLDVMGWHVVPNGLEVVFAKSIPRLIPQFWKSHALDFLKQEQLSIDQIGVFLAHPGGRKILEAIEASIEIDPFLLRYSYDVLKNHGNMSSVTILFVLKQWMEEKDYQAGETERALLCALGPGFCSEMLLIERDV